MVKEEVINFLMGLLSGNSLMVKELSLKIIIGKNNKKSFKHNHLVANRLIFYNVFSLSRILLDYIHDGNEYDEELISCLSPYITAHVNRFGKYRIYLNRQPPKLPFEVLATREKRISLTYRY